MIEQFNIAPAVADTITLAHHAIIANYYECKYQAVGYSLVGIAFVILTVVLGILHIRASKKTRTESQAWTDGLNLMGMLIFFALSVVFFITSIYKTSVFLVAKESPIGAYQLKYGNGDLESAKTVKIPEIKYIEPMRMQ